MIGKALYKLLSSNASVGALVGNRIYPLVAPQEREKPLIVYQIISAQRGYTQEGADGLAQHRAQITIVAESVEAAAATAQATRECLSGYSGLVDGVQIYLIALENEYDGTPNVESDLRAARLDFRIFWKEA